MDHLRRDEIPVALSEASRVLEPGGEFLMMVITKDVWLKFTFGPLLLHSGTRSAAQWTTLLQKRDFKWWSREHVRGRSTFWRGNREGADKCEGW